MRSLLAVLLFTVACVLPSAASDQGSIRGVLVDEHGVPVAHAEVMAMDQDRSTGVVEVQLGAPVVEVQANAPWVESDVHGQFTIGGLVVGHHYKLFGKMEMDGYPDMSDGVYNPEGDAVIAVASATPDQSVTVSLGAKAAVLHFSATDETGKPIEHVFASLERADHKGAFGGSALNNEILLPADADVIVGIMAKGYKTWYYPGGYIKESAQPVRAQSGESLKMSAQLEPEK